MTNSPSSLMNSRGLPPEVVWLEPEQIEQAKTMSRRIELSARDHSLPEAQQWQSYLNALALLSLEQWFSQRRPDLTLERLAPAISQADLMASVCYVEVNGFKLCLIAVEQVLDETVRIPQTVVEHPELAAHFYVLHEVSEEQALVMIRGFLRLDDLVDYCDRAPCYKQHGFYQLPLSLLDAEPNHLLFYCGALQPAAIALPVQASTPSADPFLAPLINTTTTLTTHLTHWLQNAFDQNWQTIDQLVNSEAYLSLNTRSLESGARRGKLINFGVQLGQQAVALLVNVTSEAEDKLGVFVQLHPTGEARYLLPDLKLSLRSSTGKILQEVVSRSQDNYIQLKSFKGAAGTRFKLAIHYGSETVEEDFEL